MKNKSIRMNLIRLKKVIAAVLVISIFFVCTGCGKSSDSAVTENKKQKAASTADVSSSDELNKNGIIFTSRRISFLPITKMYGTKHLVL